MPTATSIRALVKQIAPAPITRLARTVLLWKRRADFRPYCATKTVLGESFPFYIGDRTGELWYGRDQDPVYAELEFICGRMLSSDAIVFDVGSHHGLHAICMARRARRVIAIEPNPHNVAILRKNIRLNTLQNVLICQAAVGESAGKIALLRDSNQGGVSLANGEDSPVCQVKLLTLDGLARAHGFPHLLKIDVEGFEDRVLKGAKAILQRRPKIAIEVHVDWVSRYGSSVDEIIGLLNLDAYRVWVACYGVDQVLPWDGREFNGYPPPKFTLFMLPVPPEEPATQT